MTIREWEGVALIIGTGDIGNCISDYLTRISPNMDVILCGRKLTNKKAIYTDHQIFNRHHKFKPKTRL